MKTKLFALALMGAFTASTAFAGGGEKLKVDQSATTIDWVGKKVTGQHTGTVAVQGGSLMLENGKVTGGEFQIDFTSIVVTDLEGEWKDKLEGHLNSPDFFDTENHPTGTFKITSVKEMKKDDAGNTHTVTGDLTIKGITKSISFPAKIAVRDGAVAAVASFAIDRTDYDIKYGSGKFFEGLGDKMIDDKFEIKLKLGAK